MKTEWMVPAKWVLAGEHTVLRGGSALALPHPQWGLKIQAERTESLDSHLDCGDPALSLIVRELYTSAIEQLATEVPAISARLQSNIPLGGGLGSSAALCVGLIRLAAWAAQAPLTPERERALATELEHRFHGQSSGMDVAVVSANQPVLFTRAGGPEPLRAPILRRLPVTFHDTGARMATREAIARVQALRDKEPSRYEAVDLQMRQAVRDCEAALGLATPEAQLAGIARAMTLGQDCYAQWGLAPETIPALQKELLQKGALACKQTGAGGGGFLVALWPLVK